MSKLSSSTTNVTQEASDSNSRSCASPAKFPSYDSNISGSRFKGVVVQPNGHWGAQIYANHQRIWLGTFKTEMEAATAYDSAALKLRNGDSFRNFPWTSITAQEPSFQSQFSAEEVLNMIKDGSYPSRFADYMNTLVQKGVIKVGQNSGPVRGSEEFLCRHLFQKELTPSDVGKLNRLVIPKKNALKYFPRISDPLEKNEARGEVGDVQLLFYDRSMRLWKFRYCYWSSSQSFVFTRGWNKFVKDKQLKAKDMIIFSSCECKEGKNEVRGFCMIDVAYSDQTDSNSDVIEEIDVEPAEALPIEADEEEMEPGRETDFVGVESVHTEKKGFKLFGVEII